MFMIMVVPNSSPNQTMESGNKNPLEFSSEENYYCMTVGSTWADTIKTVPCDSNDKFQKFTKGNTYIDYLLVYA
jgi:hypothetical protein